MSGWKKRKHKLFVPDMDGQALKTIECKVCGNKFIPKKENKYIVQGRISTGGINNAFSGEYSEPKLYDAFDCDICGCQFVAKERLKTADDLVDTERERESDMSKGYCIDIHKKFHC